MILESSVEKEVTEYAKTKGWMSIKLNGHGNNGKPDRLYLKEYSKLVFIEFKRPGEAPRKLQRYWHNILVRAGFMVATVDSIEFGKQVFDEID